MFDELLEGKAPTDKFEEDYSKRYVIGLAEVALGFRPPYPLTVYNVSGDDTSGIAGLLYPSGEFLPTKHTQVKQKTRVWNDDKPSHFVKRHALFVTEKFESSTIAWDGISGSIRPGNHRRIRISERNPETGRVNNFDVDVVVNIRTEDPNALLG